MFSKSSIDLVRIYIDGLRDQSLAVSKNLFRTIDTAGQLSGSTAVQHHDDFGTQRLQSRFHLTLIGGGRDKNHQGRFTMCTNKSTADDTLGLLICERSKAGNDINGV